MSLMDQNVALGWINLIFILGTVSVVGEGVLNYFRTGTVYTPAEGDLLHIIFCRSVELLLPVSGITCVFLLAWPAQAWLVAGREWGTWQRCVQYALTLGLFCGAVAFTRSQAGEHFPFTHKAGLLMHASVLAMKLHSYMEVNRALAMRKAGKWQPRLQAAPPAPAPASPPRARSAARKRGGRGRRQAVAAPPSEPQRPDVTKSAGRIFLAFTYQDASWLDAAGQAAAEDGDAPLIAAYPANLTLYDFLTFMCMPTLVYSPRYPRTRQVRWGYVVEKALLALLGVLFCIVLTGRYIGPTLQQAADMHPAEAVVATIVPFCIMWLLFFFIVFECVCNAWAELTRFGDRHFYDEWWNSTSFTQFARTWNRPVHEWLLSHVYLAAQEWGLHPRLAVYLTFAVSIVAHEGIINGMFGFISPWLLLFSCFQFPLMSLMRSSIFKGKRLGNLTFWVGLILGVPLISLLYSREFCLRHPHHCGTAQ